MSVEMKEMQTDGKNNCLGKEVSIFDSCMVFDDYDKIIDV